MITQEVFHKVIDAQQDFCQEILGVEREILRKSLMQKDLQPLSQVFAVAVKARCNCKYNESTLDRKVFS